MEMENPANYSYMNFTFSDSSAPSLPPSSATATVDRSGDFPATSHMADLLLVSSASGSYSDDDLFRRLITDLESPSVKSQCQAAKVLRLITKHNSENRLKIARAGAVGPLVALISSANPQVQEHAVAAILNLSICEENKGRIAAAGAFKPLVRALNSGTPVVRENAACALFRLAQVEEHKIAIGKSGAIPPLVSLLVTGGLRGKKDASTALYYLCSVRENKVLAVQAGVCRPLLELMADPESGMVEKAGFVVSALAGLAEGKAAVVEEAGIPVLVEIVEVGTRCQKEIAAGILHQICEESVAYRGMVAREGAIPPLVALSQSGTTRARPKAKALIELLRQTRLGSNHSQG